MSIKRLFAIANLGFHFVLHWIRKIREIKNPVNGYEKFMEYYTSDRALPSERGDFRRQNEFARCINCGLCAAGSDNLARMRSDTNLSPALVAANLSRSRPEFYLAEQIAKEYVAEAAEWQKNCPRSVPIADALAYIAERSIQP